jgi:hypothetical protein
VGKLALRQGMTLHPGAGSSQSSRLPSAGTGAAPRGRRAGATQAAE